MVDVGEVDSSSADRSSHLGAAATDMVGAAHSTPSQPLRLGPLPQPRSAHRASRSRRVAKRRRRRDSFAQNAGESRNALRQEGGLSSGTGVRPVINPPEPARVDVAVDLGGRERAVTEQLLHDSEIGATFEQVRGEGVAQAVRVADETAQRARVEAASACREKESILGAAGELGAAFV